MSKHLTEARNYVNNLKQAPPEFTVEAIKTILLDEQSEVLHKLVTTVQKRLDNLAESQEQIIALLQKMSKPRQWEYEIERYGTTGPIKGVIAKQKDE